MQTSISSITSQNNKCKSVSIANISELMANKIFRTFYSKYMNNWQDIKTMIMLMKVYESFEEFVNLHIQGLPHNDKQDILACMTEKAFNNSDFRENICERMQEFIDGNNQVKLIDLKLYLTNNDDNAKSDYE